MFELLFAGWFQLAVLVIFISLTLVAIIYMISSMLQNDNFKKWAQNELYQVLASAMLLGSVFLFLGIIDNIVLNLIALINPSLNFQCTGSVCSFSVERFNEFVIGQNLASLKIERIECNQGYCHIEVAKSLVNNFYDVIRYYTANKIVDIGWVSIFRSMTITIYNSFTIQPLAGLQPILDIYKSFISYIAYILIWLKTNEIFLTFVSVALFPSFLVAGIALRSISIMRGLGGLLLSIAVGSFFIYPMLLIFVTTIISPDPNYHVISFSDSSGFAANIPEISDSGSAGTGNIISSRSTIDSQKESANSLIRFFEKMFSFVLIKHEDGSTSDIFTHLMFRTIEPGGFLDSIAFLSVWVIVPAVISIYGTLVFIKEFSTFLGGDIDIAGLSKLI
ncbi:MAG: hypothetical protein N3G74_00705 [Candidatus Micrarchaeota archaeon]|nr:hypothetical protein [Candidatus Micrarchaeota archaeon]